jgi:hypothetical protein
MGKLVRGVTDLATVRPDLATEWHPTKNGDASPQGYTSGSGKEAWWLCSEGHEWQAQISHRNGGRGCPYCSGYRVIRGETDLATTNPDLAAEWNPMQNGDLTPRDVMSGSHKKAWWLCAAGHEWQAAIFSRAKGFGCPVCAGQRVDKGMNDLETKNPDLARQWHPAKNGDVSPRDVMSGSHKKAWWLCAAGHEWEAIIKNRDTGAGCPICSGNKLLAGFNDLATLNPDLASEWHPTKNGNVTASDVSSSSHKKAWWLCTAGHEWAVTVNNRDSGNGCPVCAGKQVLAGFNDLATQNPGLAAEWHTERNADISPRDVTAGSGKKAWWICAQGHEWEGAIHGRHTGGGCPYCSGYFVIRGETDLATMNPGLAAEWNSAKNGDVTPSDVASNTHKSFWWICARGHEWESNVLSRNAGNGCPYCSGRLVILGETDLATVNPNLALEWHPMKNGDVKPRDVSSGSGKKVWWICEEGHEWRSAIGTRQRGRGCPRCSKTGYDPTSRGYLYLLRKEHLGLQQFGITNKPDDRLGKHERNGWELLDIVGPTDGHGIRETETALKNFFRDKGVLLPRDYPDKFDGYSESWRSDELSFSTCAEMLEALRDWEKKV